jgi:hypothetical protein
MSYVVSQPHLMHAARTRLDLAQHGVLYTYVCKLRADQLVVARCRSTDGCWTTSGSSTGRSPNHSRNLIPYWGTGYWSPAEAEVKAPSDVM